MTHPWTPISSCGDGCLPPACARVGTAHRLLRLVTAGAVLIAVAAVLATLPLRSPAARDRSLQRCFRRLLAALQVRVEVRGDTRFAPPGVPVLVVSNHVSWIDVLALGGVQAARMVGKSEVRDWSVIGPLARCAGTLFVDRDRLRELPETVAELADALRRGDAVAAFPEGTTYCGRPERSCRGTGDFRPAVFQAAIDAGAVVRPVALRYRLEGGATTVAAFVGSATLWQSVALVAGVRDLVVEVRLLPALDVTDLRWAQADRRALAAAAGAAVHAVTTPAPAQRKVSA